MLIQLRGLLYVFGLFATAFFLSSCVSNIERPVSNTRFIITPGVGLPECSIGKNKNCFIEQFGGEQMAIENFTEYWLAKPKGVEIIVKDDKIETMFFYFYSPSYASFDGKTNVGIGQNSTINDVIRAYGQPTKTDNSIISEYGAMPGTHEIYLYYARMGITFTFWNNRLADIRVFKPSPY